MKHWVKYLSANVLKANKIDFEKDERFLSINFKISLMLDLEIEHLDQQNQDQNADRQSNDPSDNQELHQTWISNIEELAQQWKVQVDQSYSETDQTLHYCINKIFSDIFFEGVYRENRINSKIKWFTTRQLDPWFVNLLEDCKKVENHMFNIISLKILEIMEIPYPDPDEYIYNNEGEDKKEGFESSDVSSSALDLNDNHKTHDTVFEYIDPNK